MTKQTIKLNDFLLMLGREPVEQGDEVLVPEEVLDQYTKRCSVKEYSTFSIGVSREELMSMERFDFIVWMEDTLRHIKETQRQRDASKEHKEKIFEIAYKRDGRSIDEVLLQLEAQIHQSLESL